MTSRLQFSIDEIDVRACYFGYFNSGIESISWCRSLARVVCKIGWIWIKQSRNEEEQHASMSKCYGAAPPDALAPRRQHHDAIP